MTPEEFEFLCLTLHRRDALRAVGVSPEIAELVVFIEQSFVLFVPDLQSQWPAILNSARGKDAFLARVDLLAARIGCPSVRPRDTLPSHISGPVYHVRMAQAVRYLCVPEQDVQSAEVWLKRAVGEYPYADVYMDAEPRACINHNAVAQTLEILDEWCKV